MAKKKSKGGGGTPPAGKGSGGSASTTPPAATKSSGAIEFLKSTFGFALLVIVLMIIFGKSTDETGRTQDKNTAEAAQRPSIMDKLSEVPQRAAHAAGKAANWLDHAGDLYTTPKSASAPAVTPPVLKLTGPITMTIPVNKDGWTAIPDVPDDRYDVKCDYGGSSLQMLIDGAIYEFSDGKLWKLSGLIKSRWNQGLKGVKWSFRVPPNAPRDYPGTATVHITIKSQR